MLPKEIVDHIFLYLPLSFCIVFQNEYVKKNKLCHLVLRNLWKNIDLSTVQWLHKYQIGGCTKRSFDHAAGRGDIEVVKFLHENRTEGCTDLAMYQAAGNGHLIMLQWLHDNRTEGCNLQATTEAAYNGQLEDIKWLYEHEIHNHDILHTSSEKGHIDVVKWICESFPIRFDNLTWAIYVASRNGHHDILEFLVEYAKSKDISISEILCKLIRY